MVKKIVSAIVNDDLIADYSLTNHFIKLAPQYPSINEFGVVQKRTLTDFEAQNGEILGPVIRKKSHSYL